VILQAASSGSPELNGITVAWLPKNVPPQVEILEATPPNYRFPPQTLTLTISRNLTLAPLTRSPKQNTKTTFTPGSSSTMNYAKGYIGARWLVSDNNVDELRARLEIRGVNESTWKLLKEDLKESNHSWDSTAFPDGHYLVRVTITDAPSNPPTQALTAQLQSDPFVIDNTAPRITGLAASRREGKAELKWHAADERNVITGAEYSVDGGEWLVAQPTTRLSDSIEHDYTLSIDLPAGEHTVAVRVTDEFDNQSVEKTVVK
jgi:hypothetical protein